MVNPTRKIHPELDWGIRKAVTGSRIAAEDEITENQDRVDAESMTEQGTPTSRAALVEAKKVAVSQANSGSGNCSSPCQSDARIEAKDSTHKVIEDEEVRLRSSDNDCLNAISSTTIIRASSPSTSLLGSNKGRRSTSRHVPNTCSSNDSSNSPLYGLFAKEEYKSTRLKDLGGGSSTSESNSDSEATSLDSDATTQVTNFFSQNQSFGLQQHIPPDFEPPILINNYEEEARSLDLLALSNTKKIPHLPTFRPERDYFIPRYRRSEKGKMYVAADAVYSGRKLFCEADQAGRRWTGEVTKRGRKVTHWISDDSEEEALGANATEKQNRAVARARYCAVQ